MGGDCFGHDCGASGIYQYMPPGGARTGGVGACHDYGTTMGGRNCQGTGGDGLNFGSGLENITVPRGIGAVVIGDKGKIMHGSHGAGGVRLIPETSMKGFKVPEKTIARVPKGNHQHDWLNAIRENRPAGSSFEYGGSLSEIGLLGMIAVRRSRTRLGVVHLHNRPVRGKRGG